MGKFKKSQSAVFQSSTTRPRIDIGVPIGSGQPRGRRLNQVEITAFLDRTNRNRRFVANNESNVLSNDDDSFDDGSQMYESDTDSELDVAFDEIATPINLNLAIPEGAGEWQE